MRFAIVVVSSLRKVTFFVKSNGDDIVERRQRKRKGKKKVKCQ